MRAWLAGQIDRVAACYSSAQQTLQAIAKSMLASEFYAQLEWQHTVRPRVIPPADHKRLVLAFDKITREAAKARTVGLTESLGSLQAPAKVSEVSDLDKILSELVMRAERLAEAEVVKAGRVAYADAVSQAIAGDNGFVWKFETDADPCGRCVSLAQRTFKTFESAPPHGAHINCRCTLEVSMKE